MFDIESVEESKTQRDREWVETDIIIIYMHNIVIVRVLWTLSEVKLWYAKSTTKKIGFLTPFAVICGLERIKIGSIMALALQQYT